MITDKCPIRTCAAASERAQENPVCGSRIINLISLFVALLVALAGCATQDRAPTLIPPVQITQETWRQVESDIVAASLAAKVPAKNYARGSMESWRDRVHKRTEADFIPWFTGYWTQQWLAIKVGWYKLNASEDTSNPAVKRLAAYLQEQYQDRVLRPVAKEIDPDLVREQATTIYVRILGEQVQGIQQRYDVPIDQFDRRLKNIPAIELAPPSAHSATLYQILHADPIAKLPAYVALIDHIRKDAGGAGAGPSDARISPVAEKASERLVTKLATSGGASAAAAAVGGVGGLIISLGALGIGAIGHESERPEMEAQIRESLNSALDDMWLGLMENPASGVMAGVNHIAEQLEESLFQPLAQPVIFEPIPREIPLSGEQSLENEESDNEDLIDDMNADD
ncbi:MAG: hypothetical protein JNM42_00810 [Propionivibrio sp.]|uniref:hypothetical protein n=1 Tax=Propionivibrio sp. TaxID=2212460 RepID=UPI001A518D9F|nr:hypothetical protein [Propionivibrio sp.]MBL8412962.1 hypothetical protein [Propionivibrio sp.]